MALSVTKFEEISLWEVYLVFGKILTLIWQIFMLGSHVVTELLEPRYKHKKVSTILIRSSLVLTTISLKIDIATLSLLILGSGFVAYFY